MRQYALLLTCFLCACLSLSWAEENEDILAQLVEEGKRNTVSISSELSAPAGAAKNWWLRGVNYLGACKIRGATAHLATLTFTEAASPNAKTPASPAIKQVVGFFDENFKLRGWWIWAFNTEHLKLSENRLMDQENTIVDFAQKEDIFIFKKHKFRIPVWK
ncbi:MAG: hypothetical protein ACOY3I_08550 [Verrucomicrobiota bacterium]